MCCSICWSTSRIRCSILAYGIDAMSAIVDSAASHAATDRLSPRASPRARLLRNPAVVTGALVLLVVCAIGLAAPWLGTVDPAQINPTVRNKLPGFEEIVRNADGSSTTLVHRMGTDTLGRD